MKEELKPPATLANADGCSMEIVHRFGGTEQWVGGVPGG